MKNSTLALILVNVEFTSSWKVLFSCVAQSSGFLFTQLNAGLKKTMNRNRFRKLYKLGITNMYIADH